jgi:hypothetical protein
VHLLQAWRGSRCRRWHRRVPSIPGFLAVPGNSGRRLDRSGRCSAPAATYAKWVPSSTLSILGQIGRWDPGICWECRRCVRFFFRHMGPCSIRSTLQEYAGGQRSTPLRRLPGKPLGALLLTRFPRGSPGLCLIVTPNPVTLANTIRFCHGVGCVPAVAGLLFSRHTRSPPVTRCTPCTRIFERNRA